MTKPRSPRILIGFHADNRETAKQLRLALAANDLEQMLQLSHGLKGSAANIGAAELKRTAHALEDACRRDSSAKVDPSRLEGLIASVASALDQVLESIQMLEKSGTSEAAESVSAETGLPVDALLKQLAEAIDRADPAAIMEIMPALRQQAARCGLIDPFRLKTLEDQVNRYDYDPALETIRKIRMM